MSVQKNVQQVTSLVDHGRYRFLITDGPTDKNIDLYIKHWQQNGVTDVVRACENTYNPVHFDGSGLALHEIPFADGEYPPDDVIDRWLDVVYGANQKAVKDKVETTTLAVHCVAGLGRAPCLVAIALIEFGMESLDAIEFLRNRRRGAINAKQLQRLQQYKRRRHKNCCVCM